MKHGNVEAAPQQVLHLRPSDRLILFMISAYFIMKPFYFWSSGLPQISDFIILVSFLAFLMKRRLVLKVPGHARKVFAKGMTFVAYVSVVNVVWYLVLGKGTTFLYSALFFTFNIGVMFYFILLHGYYKTPFIRAIYRGCLVSVLGQMVVFATMGGFTGRRNTGMFNNPNQLGYYGILIFGLLIYTSQKLKVNAMFFMFGILSAMVLTLSSLSKAAILAMTILIGGYLLTRSSNRKLKRRITAILVLALAGFTIFSLYQTVSLSDNLMFSAVQNRLDDIGKDSDDTLAMRGYDRILNYPQYWIFGSGEGGFDRFNARYEFHSTLGSLQVSYGILGLLQFLALLYYVLKKSGYQGWYIILCFLVYGFTHNGIRNSMLWMLISMYAMFPVTQTVKRKKVVPVRAAVWKRQVAFLPTPIHVPRRKIGIASPSRQTPWNKKKSSSGWIPE